ncbi:MAG: pyruvate kinase [Acidimicrobiia bacterium]|nr:pyruvate kinase [Acidimicrobiia bacterium]
MRRTKIVATVGPASFDPTVIKKMIRAGMNVTRIGLAHGSLDDHLVTYHRVREAAADAGADLSIMVDLPGPKIRCAPFPDGGVDLLAGHEVLITSGRDGSTAEVISVDYPDLITSMQSGDRIALGDGNIAMSVEGVGGDEVVTRVVRGGLVQGRPGLQVPSERLRLPTPTPEDLRLADAFIEVGVDMIAVSFVRSAHDIRRVGVEAAPAGPLLVAKVETAAAVEHLDGIVEASGAVMVARGDLGTDYALSELPHLQKHIIRRCIAMGRPVITATQMLESMVYAAFPTRAEASDVANAVFDGSSALMLSGESAIGVDPVNAVATMAEIIKRADEEFDHEAWADVIDDLRFDDKQKDAAAITTDALTMAACKVAERVDAKAIVCLSRTGFTARSVTRFRPSVPILAFSPSEAAVRQLAVSWGTRATLTEERSTAAEVRDDALRLARDRLGMASGDRVVVISGQSVKTRATDTLRVMPIP